MADLFSSRAPQFFPSSAAILLVVWSANGDCSAPQASSVVNLLNDHTYRCNVILRPYYIFHRTNRARCVLNMDILDLLNVESISEARSSRASL